MPREESFVCDFCGAREKANRSPRLPNDHRPIEKPWFEVRCLTPGYSFETQYFCTEDHKNREAAGEDRLPGAPTRPVKK